MVKPQLLELISQYQQQVTVKSDCFWEAEMPGGGGGGRSTTKGKEGSAEEEKEKERRSRMPSRGRMGAESRSTEPAASGSRSKSRVPSAALERQMKLAQATDERLRARLARLFQCKQQRQLRERINRMQWEFRAREAARKTATDFKLTLEKGELGFSHSKICTEEKRQLSFVSSGAKPFD